MQRYILSLILFGSFFIIGFIVDYVVIMYLKKITKRTKWEGDEIIISALQKWIFILITLIGLHLAINNLHLKEDVVRLLNKFFVVIYIFITTIVVSNITTGFIRLYGKKTKDVLPSASIFANIAKLFILALGLMIILNSLGISITPIITTLGIGGLAVALALQDTLSNLFSGFQIILSKQVKTGDYIRLDTGEEGWVTDITWRNTTIREMANNLIIIPNSKLANAIIVDYEAPSKDLAILIPVGVSYDSDLEKVEKITKEVGIEIMRSVPGGVPDFEPFIRYNKFGEYSIHFNVILKVKEFSAQFIVRHEFIKRLHKRYKEEGIVIPYPIRDVYLKKE